MTGAELNFIRTQLDLGVVEFGYALGYAGTQNTVSDTIRKYERGKKPVPALVARLALMFAAYGLPSPWRHCAPEARPHGSDKNVHDQRHDLWVMIEREVDEQANGCAALGPMS